MKLTTRRTGTVVMVILLTAFLVACGPEPTQTPVPPTATPTPTSTPTPTPTPTPAPALPSAESLLESALDALWTADSYHTESYMAMILETEEASVKLTMEMDGDYQAPDRVQGSMAMDLYGEETELEVITIGETVYITDPETGEWLISPEPVPIMPEDGLGHLDPEEMDELQLVGEDELEGMPVYHVKGLVSAEALDLAGLGPEADVEAQFEVEYWIGVEDGLVRKTALDGEFSVLGEEPGTVTMAMNVVYSDYGAPLDIQAPEISAPEAPAGTDMKGQLECRWGTFVPYADDELGIGFCYPMDWVVNDMVDLGGLLSVSPEGFGVADDSFPKCLVLIYPHETVSQLADSTAGAGDIAGLGFTFVASIVPDASSSGWPTAGSAGEQDIASMEADGTLGDQEVLSLIRGIRNGEAMGLAISYVTSEAYRPEAERIMDSIVIAQTELAGIGEGQSMALNAFQDGSWTTDSPARYLLGVVDGSPLLFVSQLRTQGGLDDKADLRILDPDGLLVDQFTTGWAHAQSATQHPEGGWLQTFRFGYLEPEALRLVPGPDGEYTLTVSGYTSRHEGGKYRLVIFDMGPDSPAVLEIVNGELKAGEAYNYGVDGIADRATIAFARPMGPRAEDTTLSLELFDEAEESLQEKHNYMHSGDDVFLYWVPREATPFTVRVTEVDGQPAEFELTLIEEPGTENETAEGLIQDRYHVDIDVQENGDILVEEELVFPATEGASQTGHRTFIWENVEAIGEIEVREGDQAYPESESGEAGTYRISDEGEAQIVTWHADGTPDGSSTITLRYAVRGAVQQSAAGHDVVAWQAIPPDRALRIRDARVVVHLPAKVEIHEFTAFGGQGKGSARTGRMDVTISDEVTFELSHDLPAGQGLEVRVVYGPE